MLHSIHLCGAINQVYALLLLLLLLEHSDRCSDQDSFSMQYGRVTLIHSFIYSIGSAMYLKCDVLSTKYSLRDVLTYIYASYSCIYFLIQCNRVYSHILLKYNIALMLI